MDSSRANLMIQGLLPAGDFTAEQLEERLLEGRYYEFRMLFYVGKDLCRWMEQSQELAARHPDPQVRSYTRQSFISYLILHTPAHVQTKLRKWGVADYRSIFSRALALNSMFAAVPARETLSADFIRNYFRYADTVFSMMMKGAAPEVDESLFHFELYASGEYSRMLEREWDCDGLE